MKQHGSGRGDKGGCGAKLRRALAGLGEDDVHLVQQCLGLVRPIEGQVGVGTDLAGGESRGDILRVEVGGGGSEGPLGLAAEVEVLGLGDVAPGAQFHGLDGLKVRAGSERRVHEGHERFGGEGRALRGCVIVRCHAAHAFPSRRPFHLTEIQPVFKGRGHALR